MEQAKYHPKISVTDDNDVEKITESCTPSSVLVDKSRQYANENQQYITPNSKGSAHVDGFPPRKQEVPLLQRLRVVKATGCSNVMTPQKPLPQEVIVENEDDVLGAATVFSELGVEGIPSDCTADRRRPMKFTFDGVVPSRSSLDETDTPTEKIDFDADDHHEALNILDGLEYENDETSLPLEESEQMNVISQGDAKARERCSSTGTTTSEMSIELSESQYLRSCGVGVDAKYNIFSPRSSSVGDEESPIDHGFDAIMSASTTSKNEETKQESVLSSPWIDFSFLGIW